MKVSVLTLGCRVNQSESSIIKGTLKAGGATIVNLNENPEFCIINTCSVTAKSDYNSRQLIRRAARSGAKVIVTGCYSQLKKADVMRMEGVCEVIENNRKLDAIRIITDREPAPFFGDYSRSRPYLKVQDGCNYRCSYCTVPLARGKSRSVPAEEVLRSLRVIVSQGYNEVVLTGIHLGTYGNDLNDGFNLNKLIKHMLKETDIKRVRLSSLEITEVDDELIELLRDDRLCKHLHLPLQSGSQRVLSLMKRNYEAKFYADRVRSIAALVDNISLGADIILGFPGESDGDFADTVALLSDLPLSYMHIFPFSPRPGTAASQMEGRIDPRTVKRRSAELMELNRLKKRTYMAAQINRTLEIIVEDAPEGETYIGTSGNYLRIRTTAKGLIKGSIVDVRPVGIVDDILEGYVVS